MKHAKPPKQKKGVFLNPEMEAIQNCFDDEGYMIQLPTIVKKGKSGHSGWKGHSEGTLPTVNGNSYFTRSGSSYTGVGYVACSHIASTPVFELDGKSVYAASWQGLNEYSDKYQLIIDLANNVRPQTYITKFVQSLSTVPYADALEKLVIRPQPKVMTAKLLSLSWTDMGIPPVDLDFWLEVWDKLPAHTVIACQGGHGRTGSCLVALLIAAGYSYWDALDLVRAQHCKKAVETLAQEVYLHGLYMEVLNRALAQATVNSITDVADALLADIAFAEANIPTAATTKGSKSVKTVVLDSDQATYGEPVSFRRTEAGWEEQRCVRKGCNVYHCEVADHLKWIPKALLA